MKTIIITIGILFLSINIFSQEKKHQESVRTEKIIFSQNADGYELKRVYYHNNEGLLLEKVLYVCYGDCWIPVQKYIIQHNTNKKVKNVFLIKWDKRENRWRDTIDIQSFDYDDKGGHYIAQRRESASHLKQLLATR